MAYVGRRYLSELQVDNTLFNENIVIRMTACICIKAKILSTISFNFSDRKTLNYF